MDKNSFLDFAKETAYRINPDTFHRDGSVTFIFTNDGKLFAEPWPTIHWDLLEEYPMETTGLEHVSRFNDKFAGKDEYCNATERCLLGRVSKKDGYASLMGVVWNKWCDEHNLPAEKNHIPFWGKTVSFWNTEDRSFDALDDCLRALMGKDLIKFDDLVITPTEIVRYVGDDSQQQVDTKAADRVGTATLNDTKKRDMAARIAMAKKLHLMRPDEKKAAMGQLGLVQGSVKNPWHSEMEKQQLVRPGQKWWAPQSEGFSFKQWLNT